MTPHNSEMHLGRERCCYQGVCCQMSQLRSCSAVLCHAMQTRRQRCRPRGRLQQLLLRVCSQCKFDLHSAHSTAAVPSVLYSTLDGALCAAQDAAAAAADAATIGGAWDDAGDSGGLVAAVLHREQVAICSFDVEQQGSSLLAATGDEQLLVLQMEGQPHAIMQ